MAYTVDLLDYAIVDEDAALAYCDATGTDSDVFRDIVNGVTRRIESHCRRPFANRTFTEYYDGGGSRKLYLRQFPVVSITSLTEYDGDDNAIATYTDSQYWLDSDRGVVTMKPGYAVNYGTKNWRVVYVAGYASVPDDVRLAALKMIGRAWRAQQNKRDEGESVVVQGESVTPVQAEMSPEVKSLLRPWRRPAGF